MNADLRVPFCSIALSRRVLVLLHYSLRRAQVPRTFQLNGEHMREWRPFLLSIVIGTGSICASTYPGANAAAQADPVAHRTVASAVVDPRARAPLFTFQSSFWVNLHQFLYAQAQARAGFSRRATILAALSDTLGYGASSERDHAAWERALAYYTSAVAPRDFVFDSASIVINNKLADLSDNADLTKTGLDPALVAALTGAAPLYRARWWRSHDAVNRRWIASLRSLLTFHGDTVERRVTRAFQSRWSSDPIHVDVSAYAGWAGAYTTERPSHIFISSLAVGNQESAALESIFHEALHTMDANVTAALSTAGDRDSVRVPYDVTHALIFYTAGDATRRAIPGYVPPEDTTVWRRPPFAAYRHAVEQCWQPYLDGSISFSNAVTALVRELRPLLQRAGS